MKKRLICTRCVYSEDVPNITFDEKGICNYCHQVDRLELEYPTGKMGEEKLQKLVNEIKASGKGKNYDCVVGVSGGCDSSFLLYKMKDMGLRTLATHFDNTWNTALATQNIKRVTEKLDVDLFTIIVDNKEFDDILRSFIKAGVVDTDAASDIGLTATLYKAADKFGIKYIIDAHSFRTEGVAPLGWSYMDGKYIQSVHNTYGKLPMKTFPNLWLHLFLKYILFNRIKRPRPMYYIDYHKEETKKFLSKEFGWQWYGGHHLENRSAIFFHTYWSPMRWNFDLRVLGHAALVRSGQLNRSEALALLSKPIKVDSELIEYVQKRLNLTDKELDTYTKAPKRTYKDFQTYKQTFERMRLFFWLCYKLDLVPKNFYDKFTAKLP